MNTAKVWLERKCGKIEFQHWPISNGSLLTVSSRQQYEITYGYSIITLIFRFTVKPFLDLLDKWMILALNKVA